MPRQLRRTRSPGHAVEPMRSNLQRRFIRRQRIRVCAGLEQQVAQDLTRRQDGAWRNSVLVDGVLVIGGLAERRQRLRFPALGERQQSLGGFALRRKSAGPVIILSWRDMLLQLAENI